MIKINLLPKKIRIKYEILVQHFVILLLSSLCVFFILLYFNSYVERRSISIDEEIAMIKRTVDDLDKIVSEVKKTEEKKSYLENQLAIIEKLYQSKTGPVRMLADLAENIPEDLWVTSIAESNNKITISGEAMTQFIIADFLDNLKKSSYFKNITIGAISGTTTKTFVINAESSYM